jgi:TrmH family RNA methyltransferase
MVAEVRLQSPQMERISSRQNPLVRRFRELSSRPADDRVLLDGEHLLTEALTSHVPIEVAAVGDAFLDHSLTREVARQGGRVVAVSAPVLAAMSPVRQPSGVVAIATRRTASLEDALARAPQLVLFLSDVQDPGNVGAIVRAAEACGATGIVTGEGTADPYGWKALRGSMGSVFRVPVAARVAIADAVRAARAQGIRILAAVPRDGEPLPAADLRQPSAILLGGEGSGVPAALAQMADARLSIPMRPPVESLNVSVAAALIAYEASRQRARP